MLKSLNSKDKLKAKQQKVNRSRSRSLSPKRSHDKLHPKTSKKLPPKTSRDKNKNKPPQNASLARSHSKSSLKISKSQKKLKRNSSHPKIGSSPTSKNISKKPSIIATNLKAPKQQSIKTKESNKPPSQQVPNNSVKIEEREMGLIFIKPQHDKIIFKSLQITDIVFDKYLQMINNDNDANYVMNALPQLRNYKKQDESQGRDFASGRISRLSGIFDGLSVDKIITPIKKVPNYYSGQCGKNLTHLRIMLQTKFKVEVDLGFLQFSLDGDKLTIFRIYVSKIYRRMNYIGYVYLEGFKALMQRHPGADRWSIFILQKNLNVHKFFKYLGFHIQKIASQSKNRSVDYFQQFTIKKKELNTIIATMTK